MLQMIIIQILLYFPSISNIRHNANSSIERELRMFKGDDASLYEYTFMTVLVGHSIVTKDSRKNAFITDTRHYKSHGRLACGGAIVHRDWILTSAKCFESSHLSNFEVYAGIANLDNRVGQQIRTIARIVIHPEYNPSSNEYNIAMVKMASSFIFTTHVSSGILPDQPLSISGVERCHVLGFVKHYNNSRKNTYYERLIKVELHAIDYIECSERLEVLRAQNLANISTKNYCVVHIAQRRHKTNPGICQGDVGGPCICGFKIQGIISTYSNETCYKSGYPTIITDVGYHLNWIRKVVLNLNVIPRNCATSVIQNKFILDLIFLPVLLINKIT